MADLFASVQPLAGALDYHLERHNVLATNVAHVDTPGFVPKDVARAATGGFAGVLDVALARTSALHLSGDASRSAVAARVFDDPAAGAGNDRNYVSLDREAAKIAANHVRYDVVSTLVAAHLAQLAFATTDGRG